MRTLQQQIYRQPWFFALTLAFIASLAVVVSCCSKTQSFLAVNFYHHPALDRFFTYYTNMGDGLFCCAVILLLLLFRKRSLPFKLFLSYIFSGLLAQVLKHLYAEPRPRAYFPDHFYNHFIQGVTLVGHNSFPSGHETTAFAMAATLALNMRDRRAGLLFGTLAISVGYSRVYLGQHFIQDILAGTLIGLFTAVLVEYLYHDHFFKWQPFKDFFSRSKRHEQHPVIEL